MFFKHVELHKYDLTNAGIDQACYDELKASGNNSTGSNFGFSQQTCVRSSKTTCDLSSHRGGVI